MANPTMGFDSCMLLGFDRGYWTWVLIVHAIGIYEHTEIEDINGLGEKKKVIEMGNK